MDYQTKENWYAVFVATGDEDNVKERINYKLKDHLRAVVPKRKMRERKKGIWEDKIRTLFPGYVLLKGDISSNTYYCLRSIPGVIRILTDINGPQQIHKQEIEIICRLTTYGETIGSSRVYTEGGKIIVMDGPLYGMEGYIQSIDKRKGRVKVSLNLMNEFRIVELCVSLVQLA